MRSIRLRLLVPLSAGLALLFLLGGLLIYLAVSTTLREGFDTALVEKAHALASRLVLEIDPDVRPEAMRLGAQVLDAMDRGETVPADVRARAKLMKLAEQGFVVRFASGRRARRAEGVSGGVAYFQIWRLDGEPLARSPALGDEDLPGPPGEFASPDVTERRLPAGRLGRVAALRVEDVPFRDEAWQDVWSKIRGEERALVHQALVVVAEEREALDTVLSRLGLALTVVGLALVVGCAVLVLLVLRRGLAPLADLERQIAALGAGSLDRRIRLTSPPAELTAVVDGLNRTLDALEQSFARERRTTANIAHELRTPIAELRSLMEVANEFPEDESLRTQALEQGQEVAIHMSRIVSALLKVARLESGDEHLQVEALEAGPLVASIAGLLQTVASARRQELTIAVPEGFVLPGDREAVEAILTNLLQNAIQHAPEGSEIHVRGEAHVDGPRVTLSNPNAGLTPEDLEHVTEPFWRRDAERSPSWQGGLGLPLAAELASTAGLILELALEDGHFVARLQSRGKADAGA